MKLKNNKSTGKDGICNEMLKSSKHTILPVLKNLFNHIYTSGSFPVSWSCSMIKPLYKNGSKYEPSNYRGISLSSCLGKLFCMILNTRLLHYMEDNNLFTPLQIAFRKDCRTSDHIFVLKTIIDKYLNINTRGQRKYLYTCFIDFRKAFDTVWQEGMLHKLLELGIGRHFYNIVKDMYKKNCAQVKLKQGLTESFAADIGVKQGCVLSPTLFNIFLNDLPAYLDNTNTDPVYLSSQKLNCLMYADDLVLMSTSREGLQNCLYQLQKYCDDWKLDINVKKTKIIVFNKQGKTPPNVKFTFQSNELEIVKQTKYLGLIFSNTGAFKSAVSNLKDKGNKALFKIYKSFANTPKPIKTMIHLFDSLIKPIQTYGSDIWGAYCINIDKILGKNPGKTQLYFKQDLEKLHTSWCKYTLQVHDKSTNIAVLAELGRYPLTIDVITGMIKYWARMKNNKNKDNLLNLCYLENQELLNTNKPCWLSAVNKTLNELGLSWYWNCSHEIKPSKLAKTVKTALQEIFKNQFKLDLTNDERKNPEGNKLRTFRKFKHDIKLEFYLLAFKKTDTKKYFSRLRTSSHNLAVETGRHRKPNKVPLHERTCLHCNNNEVEDEEHVMMSCSAYKEARTELLNKLNIIYINFQDYNESEKFEFIMKCNDYELCMAVEVFINKVIITRGPL